MGEEGRLVLGEGSRRTGGKANAPAPREHPLLAGEKASQTYLRKSLRLQNMGSGLREPQEGRQCGEDLGATLEEVWIR